MFVGGQSAVSQSVCWGAQWCEFEKRRMKFYCCWFLAVVVVVVSSPLSSLMGIVCVCICMSLLVCACVCQCMSDGCVWNVFLC